jgi:LysR family transcriptional regulator (chromosome initiation inhibitor)
MIDYRGLEALYTVIQLQNFEAAAEKLFITQSAVSQRIKSLESDYGEPLLIRNLPYQPTPFAEPLLAHYQHVRQLEQTLQGSLQQQRIHPKISIAINRDSLETWFMDLLTGGNLSHHTLLDIIADDQAVTLDYLKKGLVSACISTVKKPLSGCSATFLGYLEYALVASPTFKTHYFDNKPIKDSLLNAPILIFDYQDKLHERFLAQYFAIHHKPENYYTIPSVRGFRKFALQGYGFALIPLLDIEKELRTGKLVILFDNKIMKMPLYWHHFSIESAAHKAFNRSIIEKAQEKLA